MAKARPRHLWRFAGGDAPRAFVLAALLPLWTAWYFSSWGANGEITWFPLMLHSFGRAAFDTHPHPNLLEYYGVELGKVVAVLFVGAAVGVFLGLRPVRPVSVARSSLSAGPDKTAGDRP